MPRSLTWIPWLVLPALVGLGWMGFHAVDGLEAALTAQAQEALDARLDDGARRLATERDRLDAEIRATLQAEAARLAREIPQDGLHAAMAAARSRLGNPAETRTWTADLHLVDAQGVGLDPRGFVPADRRPSGVRSAKERLFEDLHRRAERAALGEGDVQAGLDLWQEASLRLPQPAWRLEALVQRAWLQVRTLDPIARPGAARDHVRDLREREDADGLPQTGRAYVLLLLAAEDQVALEALHQTGALVRTPLTRAEREAAGAAPSSTGLRWDVSLPGGARLHAWVEAASVQARLLDDLGTPPPGLLQVLRQGSASGEPSVKGARWRAVGRLGGRPLTLGLAHRDLSSRHADIRRQRMLWTLGLIGLLAVVALGLWFLRRAGVQERRARALRDAFIANVTHEVRTPLASVLLHAALLAETDPSPKKRIASAHVVEAEGRRLAALVEDMLDFSTLAQGTRVLAPAPLDLAALVRDAVAPYRVLAEREGVALSLSGAEEAVEAVGDAGAVARILGNLLANAWKHGRPSRDGSPGRIRVWVEERGRHRAVGVQDDGPGIHKEDRVTIFERFGRGRDAAGTAGAGLGLALSRELAQAQGGDLVLDAGAEATCFVLTLPADATPEGSPT